MHRHYLEAGLVCKMKMHYFTVTFSYAHKSNAVWDFITSPDGANIYTKAKNLDKYADEIPQFPPHLQQKIAEGYGCEKKRFGAPCRKGCHGFRFPADGSLPEIGRDLMRWLDREAGCLQKNGAAML
jgi:hypothetical protein